MLVTAPRSALLSSTYGNEVALLTISAGPRDTTHHHATAWPVKENHKDASHADVA
jgi:hypothetical protein